MEGRKGTPGSGNSMCKGTESEWAWDFQNQEELNATRAVSQSVVQLKGTRQQELRLKREGRTRSRRTLNVTSKIYLYLETTKAGNGK